MLCMLHMLCMCVRVHVHVYVYMSNLMVGLSDVRITVVMPDEVHGAVWLGPARLGPVWLDLT